jgi:hypothetical protein
MLHTAPAAKMDASATGPRLRIPWRSSAPYPGEVAPRDPLIEPINRRRASASWRPKVKRFRVPNKDGWPERHGLKTQAVGRYPVTVVRQKVGARVPTAGAVGLSATGAVGDGLARRVAER